MSERVKDWQDFSLQVEQHIESYTLKQYGEKGNDLVSKKDSKYCIDQIERYCQRFGKNSREGQQELDLLKMAHYAQIAFEMLKKEN